MGPKGHTKQVRTSYGGVSPGAQKNATFRKVSFYDLLNSLTKFTYRVLIHFLKYQLSGAARPGSPGVLRRVPPAS